MENRGVIYYYFSDGSSHSFILIMPLHQPVIGYGTNGKVGPD